MFIFLLQNSKKRGQINFGIHLTGFLLLLFSFSTLLAFDVDPVGKNIKEGVERYKTQDFQGSLDSFNQADSEGKEDERISFNKGTSYFKLNDYKLALKYFEKSAHSEDKNLKLRSQYNLGNTYAKLGDKKNAIKSYLDALNTNPEFMPARKNLELLTTKDKKDKEKQDQEDKDKNSEKDEDKEDKKEDKNSTSKKDNSSSKKQDEKSEKQNEDKDKQSKSELTKEEAERILESAKQNKINRKKMNSKRQDRNEVFW